MRKDLRLRSPKLYKQVYAQGRSVHAEDLVLHFLYTETGEPARVGLSVSKRVGNAVTRNRVKRRLRAVVAEVAGSLRPGSLLVLVAKPRAATITFQDIKASVLSLMARARALEEGTR